MIVRMMNMKPKGIKLYTLFIHCNYAAPCALINDSSIIFMYETVTPDNAFTLAKRQLKKTSNWLFKQCFKLIFYITNTSLTSSTMLLTVPLVWESHKERLIKWDI